MERSRVSSTSSCALSGLRRIAAVSHFSLRIGESFSSQSRRPGLCKMDEPRNPTRKCWPFFIHSQVKPMRFYWDGRSREKVARFFFSFYLFSWQVPSWSLQRKCRAQEKQKAPIDKTQHSFSFSESLSLLLY